MGNYHQWNKEEVDFVEKNYPLMGSALCSEKLGLPRQSIISYAFRNGIKTNPKVKGYSTKIRHDSNRKKRDIDARNITVTTPEQSYTLGFIWGDGHLHKADPILGRYYANIEIVKDDYNNICRFFKCFGKWSEKERHRNGCKILTCATLFDGVLGSFLKANDYDIKSTISPSKILASIPNKLHSFFWRGFIDADGCFGLNKNSGYFHITGSYNQEWHDFEKLLQRLNIKYTVERKSSYSGNISRVSVYSRRGITALGKFIYGSQPYISLQRKRNKFLEIIKS